MAEDRMKVVWRIPVSFTIGVVAMRSILLCFLTLCLSLAIQGPLWAASDVRHSVVKILTISRLPNPERPWAKQNPREVYASGVVIMGKRILTNAHVVGFADQIYVQPYQSAEKIAARVAAKAPGIDLAVLELEDESFFQKYPPLGFAEHLPKSKETVNVYGYPTGGKEQSVTEGIVSRIEYANMYYDSWGLRIQIDAPLNAGNSGGPALIDNKIIGLVFSKMTEAENIGYLIPVKEIQIFLNDVSDGSYEGQPKFYGLGLQTAENNALRDRLGLEKGTSGLMVNHIYSRNPYFPLKPGDVITHIGGHSIDSEGQVRVHGDLRVRFDYFVPRLAKDSKVELTVIRDGKPQELQVPVSVDSKMLIPFLRHEYPRYFIYGPLTFIPAHWELVRAIPQRLQQYLMQVGSPIVTRGADPTAFEGEELVVVASPMFPHKITKGYDPRIFAVVSHVNDAAIKNLSHLVETLRNAKDEYIVFRFACQRTETLVFRREEIEAATEEILIDNGIRNQFSEDLRSIWEQPARK